MADIIERRQRNLQKKENMTPYECWLPVFIFLFAFSSILIIYVLWVISTSQFVPHRFQIIRKEASRAQRSCSLPQEAPPALEGAGPDLSQSRPQIPALLRFMNPSGTQ